METISNIVRLLFRHISAQGVIEGKIDCSNLDSKLFVQAGSAYEEHYSEVELTNLWNYCKREFENSRKAESMWDIRVSPDRRDIQKKGINVFDAAFYYVCEILDVRDNEIICRYDKLMQWRMLTFELSEEFLVAAYYAQKREPDAMTIQRLSWKIAISHDNYYLRRLMERGISENHFHLWGSAPVFQLSWISLMNNTENSAFIRTLKSFDERRRYRHVAYSGDFEQKGLEIQYMQAALIRVFLYSWLTQKEICVGSYELDYDQTFSWFSFENSEFEALEKCEITDSCLSEVWDGRSDKEGFYAGEIIEELDLVVEKEIRDSFCDFLRKAFGDYKYFQSDFSDVKNPVSLRDLVCIFWKIKRCVSMQAMEPFLEYTYYHQQWYEKTLHNVQELLRHEILLEDYLGDIQNIILSLRDNNAPDYALCFDRVNNYEDMNCIFAGERWLLYQMLYRIHKYNEDETPVYNLFYTYILLRENIRSEILQSNTRNVGFDNFQIYEHRKTELLDDHIFNMNISRLAVQQSFFPGNLRSLEIRTSPKRTAKENAEYIEMLDRLIGDPGEGKVYYYVMHFLKRTEKPRQDSLHCRHYNLRQQNLRMAKALLNFRELYPLLARRVIGIDAASQEIGCRPEVFAPVFRLLRNHTRIVYDVNKTYRLPQLRVTYHVGEDFLDVVDGLRAIDEAIKFLNMESGDRMGHGIALGIDADDWYASKNNRVILSKQDYLDNIAWMYYFLIQYNIEGTETLKDRLLSDFSNVFDQVYRKNISIEELTFKYALALKSGASNNVAFVQGDFSFDIHTYYQAWRFRGDDPELYIHGYFSGAKYENTEEKYKVNSKYRSVQETRNNVTMTYLYYSYHYNEKVREAGAEKIEVVVEPYYIDGVKKVQKALQGKIARLGIGIEANPSSNFLIGTFKRYDKHPILNFYNKGLTVKPEELMDCPQLSVSINTDDLGIFSTALENEYALMANALENVKDENGNYRYAPSMIYDWLDNIRIMGNDQAFLS